MLSLARGVRAHAWHRDLETGPQVRVGGHSHGGCLFFFFRQEHFAGALDRFAQFFISPLFTEAATSREMNAVDSENAKNQQSDMWRLHQLKLSLARDNHPLRHFGNGSSEMQRHQTIERRPRFLQLILI